MNAVHSSERVPKSSNGKGGLQGLGARPIVTDEHLDIAIRLVERCNLRTKFDAWIADYRRSQNKRGGGRPPVLHPATVYTLFLTLQLETRPMHFSQVASLLSGLTDSQRSRLGIDPKSAASADEWYDRAYRAWHALEEAIDPYPRPGRHERPTKAAYDEATQRCESDPHTAVRRQRLDELANLIVEATLAEIPKEHRPASYAAVIDATPMPEFALGQAKARKRSLQPHERMSIEPEAGFYARGRENHADDPKLPASNVRYAYELEVLVGMHPDVARTKDAPIVILGIGLHPPGEQIGQNARKVLEGVLSRGHVIDEFIADRAYLPGAKVEDLQGFLFDRGIRAVMDYRKDQVGIQALHEGMIMVDGLWYSPSMPAALRNLGQEYKKAMAQYDSAKLRGERPEEPDFTSQFEARAKFAFRRKERPDRSGATPMMCPAVGPGATLSCPLKALTTPGARFPVLDVPAHPGKACTNTTSISVPRDADGGKALKYQQHYAYGTTEWKSRYGRRNHVESMNYYLKGAKGIDLDVPGRRRVRGASSKYLLASMAAAVANLHRINDFLADHQLERAHSELGRDGARRRSGKSSRRDQVEKASRVAERMLERRPSAA